MTMSKKSFLSLVIPAYNEALRLPQTLEELGRHRARWAFDIEIIVVVELSTDKTLELAQGARTFLPELRVIANSVQLGKGHAVRTGMKAAQGELIFFTDADLSTPLQDLDYALHLFRSHPDVDVVVGNRQHPETQILRRQSRLRELMGKTFNRLVRVLSGLRISDTQCGFKGFRHAAAQEIFSRQQTNGFAFDVEVLLLASALGFQVLDMPVHWSNSPESKVHVVHDSLRMLRETFLLRRRIAALPNRRTDELTSSVE
jgi:dolichyl-phosphate beta-glucosyltransferase